MLLLQKVMGLGNNGERGGKKGRPTLTLRKNLKKNFPKQALA